MQITIDYTIPTISIPISMIPLQDDSSFGISTFAFVQDHDTRKQNDDDERSY